MRRVRRGLGFCFSALLASGSGCDSQTGLLPELPPPSPPTGSIAADPVQVERGQVSLLSWSTRNATSVSIAPGIGSVAASGSLPVSPATTTTYVLSASGPGGTLTPEPSVTIAVSEPPVAPTGSITANPTMIERGACSMLSWTTMNATSQFIDQGIGSVGAGGTLSVCPSSTTTYTLSASGPGGTLTPEPSVTIAVSEPPVAPTGSITANPTMIERGACSMLSWTTMNATSQFIDQGIGSVGAGGTLSVCPSSTTTYTLSASGPGGTLTPEPSVTIAVSEPPVAPTGSITANPTMIERGACSMLSWTTMNATSQFIDQDIGSVGAGGTLSVCPSSTTTYTLSASGPGGTLTPEPSVTIAVSEPPVAPTGSITANPTMIERGACSMLSWTTMNATSQFIDQGIGSVGAGGTLSVCPSSTTTYTLSASGPGGILSPEPSVTVTVIGQQSSVTGSITANPDSVAWGSCSTLSWTTSYTTRRSIDPWVGHVSETGLLSVCPSETTTFVLGGSGPEGRLDPEPSVTITVREQPVREVSRCQDAAITVGLPKRISTRWQCEEIYAIDLSIEANSGDAMIADLFRSYAFTDWRVDSIGGRVRHDARVYWFPYEGSFLVYSESAEIQPMTIHTCPEGGKGSVTACSDSSCQEYNDADHVDPVRPATLGVVFAVPWGYSTVHQMQEGDTFDIPVRYEIQDALGGSVELRMDVFSHSIWGRRLSRDLEITPDEHVFSGGRARSGEVVFQIHSRADQVDQGEEGFAALFSFSRKGSDLGGCLVLPNYVQVRIKDPQ